MLRVLGTEDGPKHRPKHVVSLNKEIKNNKTKLRCDLLKKYILLLLYIAILYVRLFQIRM
jgi:hypothetical protein